MKIYIDCSIEQNNNLRRKITQVFNTDDLSVWQNAMRYKIRQMEDQDPEHQIDIFSLFRTDTTKNLKHLTQGQFAYILTRKFEFLKYIPNFTIAFAHFRSMRMFFANNSQITKACPWLTDPKEIKNFFDEQLFKRQMFHKPLILALIPENSKTFADYTPTALKNAWKETHQTIKVGEYVEYEKIDYETTTTTTTLTLDMIRCEKGSFVDYAQPYGNKIHRNVGAKIIKQPFRMSSTEITNGLFSYVMNLPLSKFPSKYTGLNPFAIYDYVKDSTEEWDTKYPIYTCTPNTEPCGDDIFSQRFKSSHYWLKRDSDYADIQSETQAIKEKSLGKNKPITHLSLLEIVVFCNRLSALENLEPIYEIDCKLNTYYLITFDTTKNGYRLPTTTEWEYAAHAGQNSMFVGTSIDKEIPKYANITCKANKNTKTEYPDLIDVAQKKPNAWGFYDMNGNVSEICGDAPFSDRDEIKSDAEKDETRYLTIANFPSNVQYGQVYQKSIVMCIKGGNAKSRIIENQEKYEQMSYDERSDLDFLRETLEIRHNIPQTLQIHPRDKKDKSVLSDVWNYLYVGFRVARNCD